MAPPDMTTKRRLMAEAGSILRFGVVGAGASATYVLVALLVERAGLSPQGANLVAVVASTTVSFLGHLFYSFRKTSVKGRYVVRFLGQSAAVYVVTIAGTHAGTVWLGWPYWVVVFAIAAAVPLFTWTAGRFWVFR